jgi:hypothetical protein
MTRNTKINSKWLNKELDKDTIIPEIEINKEIEELKEEIKKRKRRKDSGYKRGKYMPHLPKHFRSYIMRANKKGIEFNITLVYFNELMAANCVYCGASGRISLDRINSKEGYTIENIQPCCITCNMMKYTYSHEAFISHIRRIYRHLQQSIE